MPILYVLYLYKRALLGLIFCTMSHRQFELKLLVLLGSFLVVLELSVVLIHELPLLEINDCTNDNMDSGIELLSINFD